MTTYPEILGTITKGERQTIGVVQAALAMRPFAVRAGRVFEVLVLLQNMSDAPLDVHVTLKLPETDHKNHAKRFVARRTRLGVDVQPAEVGLVVLPAACLPDTAPGVGYKVQVEVQAKAKTRPHRVRHENAPPIDPSTLNDTLAEQVETLQRLRFAGGGGLLRKNVLENTFNVMPGGPAPAADLQAEWQSLWTVADGMSERDVIVKERERIMRQLLPALRRDTLFEPLRDTTQQQFADAGFELLPIEALFIGKMLALVAELAAPEYTGHGLIAGGEFSITPMLNQEDIPETLDVPHWFHEMLTLMKREPRIAAVPQQVLPTALYLPLLRDAITCGFEIFESTTGHEAGSAAEKTTYTDKIIRALETNDEPLSFGQVYMPLVIAGLATCKQTMLPKESEHEMLVEMTRVLDLRGNIYHTEDTAVIFEVIAKILKRGLRRYGTIDT